MTGFRRGAPFSWDTSTVSCRQRYFRCAFEQISIGVPKTRAFSGQSSPRVWALQAGSAGSAPDAQQEAARSIGITNRMFCIEWTSYRGLECNVGYYRTTRYKPSGKL